MPTELDRLLIQVRRCQLCQSGLPLGPRPVVQIAGSAKIVIIGQAPGSKVHASGIPWDDASGKRLRQWLGISSEDFYNANEVAMMPMGFCYPGKAASGDRPPRKECAPLWHSRLLEYLPERQLTLLIGHYAQHYYLPNGYTSLTENVRHWRQFGPAVIPLPHPSPRNQIWFRKNPWFADELVPQLQQRISSLLDITGPL